ncbi:beta-galactosidase [Candidatus Daviesbacteria bacterium]|nr:beta-galactosidase [Candidatus Daviesbacteria bacterium]
MRIIFFSALVALFILVSIFISGRVYEQLYSSSQKVEYGVTFSPRYAKYLNLDWQKVYTQILDDLKVRNLRLTSYWDTIEFQKAQYDFSETDFLIKEAGKREAKAVLVLGSRQPRWPECHIPTWAKDLTITQRQQKVLEFIKAVVEKYKTSDVISAWQVENEPFAYWFGENCDTPDIKFLQEEINLVKKLDSRPVVTTDSGEWSDWIDPMKLSDILGISLYRRSYSSLFNLYITYPLPVWMYPAKANLVKKLFAPNNQKIFISELQAEPWTNIGVLDTSLDEQVRLFSAKDLQGNVLYAQKTGFDSIYLWGVEWWFYMAQNGYPEYLEYTKTLFR